MSTCNYRQYFWATRSYKKNLLFFKQDWASVFSVRDEVCFGSQGGALFVAYEGEGDLNTFTGVTTTTQHFWGIAKPVFLLHVHRKTAYYIHAPWTSLKASLGLVLFVYGIIQKGWRGTEDTAHVRYMSALHIHETQKKKWFIHISGFYFIPTYFNMLRNLQQFPKRVSTRLGLDVQLQSVKGLWWQQINIFFSKTADVDARANNDLSLNRIRR